MDKAKSVELLNKAVAMELTALHQYMYFHFRCDDYGYDLLASIFKRIAIQEMLHVEMFAERIFFLKGDVMMKWDGEVQHIADVEKMLELATQLETDTVAAYNKFANECSANADSVSKTLFERIIGEEEVHEDQFEVETDNMTKFGANYLALQSIERSKTIAASPIPGASNTNPGL